MHHRWTYRVLRPDLQMQTSPAAAFYVQLNLKQGLSLNSYQTIFCFMTYMGVCVQSLIYSQQTRFYKSAHPQTHMIYFALWLEFFFLIVCSPAKLLNTWCHLLMLIKLSICTDVMHSQHTGASVQVSYYYWRRHVTFLLNSALVCDGNFLIMKIKHHVAIQK